MYLKYHYLSGTAYSNKGGCSRMMLFEQWGIWLFEEVLIKINADKECTWKGFGYITIFFRCSLFEQGRLFQDDVIWTMGYLVVWGWSYLNIEVFGCLKKNYFLKYLLKSYRIKNVPEITLYIRCSLFEQGRLFEDEVI